MSECNSYRRRSAGLNHQQQVLPIEERNRWMPPILQVRVLAAYRCAARGQIGVNERSSHSDRAPE